MEARGVSSVLDLGVIGDVAALNMIRTGDTVYVAHMHLLAERKKTTDHNPRSRLKWWAVHLVKRGVVLVELANGNRAERAVDTKEISNVPALVEVFAAGIEVITRGARGRAVEIARENGKKSKGRPRKPWEKTEADARAVYFDADLKGKKLIQALRRIGPGWTYKRAWQAFGARFGNDD